MTNSFSVCPVCQLATDSPEREVPAFRGGVVSCRNCGEHAFTSTALAMLEQAKYSDAIRARLAYAIGKVPENDLISSTVVEAMLRTSELPGALERIDNLIMLLAKRLAPGERTTLSFRLLRASIGAATEEEVRWVTDEAAELGYINSIDQNNQVQGGARFTVDRVALTVKGWERFESLMRDGTKSCHAFMAMQFGDEELIRVFNEHMRDAVAQTGFELRTVNGAHQTAGSIDNRMRVEIRTSRFLICDLTHGNRGAYWEAGFAEGIGRPVFYTCREDVLHDRSHAAHPHFDINHQLIVKWNPANPMPAMQALKDAIRATLPAEARMEDVGATHPRPEEH